MTMKKSDIKKNATWLKSYAKGKAIKNFGGNFWGFNRNRCTIIQPEMVKALVDGGYAKMEFSDSFRMI